MIDKKGSWFMRTWIHRWLSVCLVEHSSLSLSSHHFKHKNDPHCQHVICWDHICSSHNHSQLCRDYCRISQHWTSTQYDATTRWRRMAEPQQFLLDPENLITSHPKVKQLLKRIACSNITNWQSMKSYW